MREALFSMVGQHLGGWTVLDAFGGSGLLGLEAWSRGGEVTVYDRDRRAVAAIRANGAALGAGWKVRRGDVLAAGLEVFDLVLADPPYATDPGVVLQALAPSARRALVLETASSANLPASVGTLRLDRRRAYGDTALALYLPLDTRNLEGEG